MSETKMPPRLVRSGLTGRVYVVTRYKQRDDGFIEARTKYDVTKDFLELVAHPWAGDEEGSQDATE